MPSADASTLALAARLRRLDDSRLEDLLRRRAPELGEVHDFFDLADALLQPESLTQALSALDRATLAAIATVAELGAAELPRLRERLPDDPMLDEHLATAVELALLDREDGHVIAYDPLATLLDRRSDQALPTRASLLADSPPPVVVPAIDEEAVIATDRSAAERAFATVAAIAELLIALERQPARSLARGRFSLPDTRRIAEAAHVDADAVAMLHDIAVYTGLIALSDDLWAPTSVAAVWLRHPRVDRWRQLAEAWLDRIGAPVREVLRLRSRSRWDDGLIATVEWLYPMDRGRIRSRVIDERRVAEALGIVADLWPSSAGAALVNGRESTAAAAMAAHFPAEVERVYVQHDLSVIAPGPLDAGLDARLRRIAEAGDPGIVSSYRITPGSLTRGIAAGETPDSIRELLLEISLTGVPQPLEYLIAEAGARFGAVRVTAADAAADTRHDRDHDAPKSIVHSGDPALLAAIAVDRQLAALALRPHGDGSLSSRIEPAAVFWALSDARYPVALESDSGAVLPPQPRPHARRSQPKPDRIPDLVRKLRERATGEPPDTERAWFARQLDLAVKARHAVIVTVRMPDGHAVDYTLEPTALASGRLRARDRNVDVERTLPLSHITAVAPVPADGE